MRYDSLRIESTDKARLTWNSESAPLYVKGDILTKGTIHTSKEIVLHDSKALDTDIVYPGTIRFWGGDFYGYASPESGWVNWTNPVVKITEKFEELRDKIESRELWKPFWGVGDDPGSDPMGWNFQSGRIAIGKPYAGDALFEVGGDVLFDRRLTVRGQIRADMGIRLGDTHVEQPGTMRFRDGLFEGYNGNEWIHLFGGSPVIEQVQERLDRVQENCEYPVIDMSKMATRDYVDRMVSVGLVWLPVVHFMVNLGNQEKLGETFITGDDEMNIGGRVWFRRENGQHMGIREILEVDFRDGKRLLKLGEIREDPNRKGVIIQPGTLYGVIISDNKRQQTWWIQVREDGVMESGEFHIYPERVVDVERVVVEKTVVQDTIREEYERWKRETSSFYDSQIRQFEMSLINYESRPAVLSPGMIEPSHIQSKAIRTEHFGDSVIKNIHIGDGVIEPRHLSSGCFRLEHLADGSIQSKHLGKGAVTSSIIAPGAIEEYHLYGKMDPRRIFNLKTLADDWFQDKSIGTRVLRDQCITGVQIQEHVIRPVHLHRDFVLDGGFIRQGTLLTSHFRRGEISGSILKPESGEPNFFGAGRLPGWSITPNSMHADALIRETLTSKHFEPKYRGFQVKLDSNLWGSESSVYCELGGELNLRLSPEVSFWQQLRNPGRDWVALSRMKTDIELGERDSFDRVWWDDKGFQGEWNEIPERWSHINLYGMTESRGIFIHRGNFVVRGNVDIPELNNQRRVIDQAYRYALYQSCPIGSIVCWRLNRPIPTGWRKVELESSHESLIWIEKFDVGLVAEETLDVDGAVVEEADGEEDEESNEPL